MLNMISNKMRTMYLDVFKEIALRIFDRNEEKGHDPAHFDANIVQEK
jgi:hypothetical protein